MTALRADPQEWRRPGCDQRCQERTIIASMPMRRVLEVVHDPDAHEEYGITLALGEPEQTVKTGALVVNLSTGEAYLAGRSLHLTQREWTLLETLALARGGICPHQRIAAALWPDDSTVGLAYNSSAIQMVVNRLRRKLRGAEDLIETNVGRGYRLAQVAPSTALRLRPVKRWALAWDHCQGCGTTERAHDGRGLCGPCRSRSARRQDQP